MLILQADVPFQRTSVISDEVANEQAIQSYFDFRSNRLDNKCVHSPSAFEANIATGASWYTAPVRCSGLPVVSVFGSYPRFVNLNFVPLVNGELPIICRVIASEHRNRMKHS